MSRAIKSKSIDILRDYAAGMPGKRQTIERTGLQDYPDLMIAMVQNDFAFPKPADTPEHRARIV